MKSNALMVVLCKIGTFLRITQNKCKIGEGDRVSEYASMLQLFSQNGA